MNNFVFGLLVVVSLAVLLYMYYLVFFPEKLRLLQDELWYSSYFKYRNRWEPYMEQNKLSHIPNPKPVSLCFITLETRGERDEYVKLHNRSFQQYVDYHNKLGKTRYAYKFFETCCADAIPHRHNVYWCKLFCLRETLEKGEYDYVVWVDSDTIIRNREIDFGEVLQRYDSDWFGSLDAHKDILKVLKIQHPSINAGVLAVRNSEMGKKILGAITDVYNEPVFKLKCVSDKNELKGAWSGLCYEQGMMNWMLHSQFSKHITVLPSQYIYHGNSCEDQGQFIIHLFQNSSESRAKCFSKFVD